MRKISPDEWLGCFIDKLVSVDDCWEIGVYHTPKGYANVAYKGRTVKAHRAAYTEFIGEIPAGLEIDHLCHNRGCVNPDHLEAVTQEVNKQRAAKYNYSEFCRRGHPRSNSKRMMIKATGRLTSVCYACLRVSLDKHRDSRNARLRKQYAEKHIAEHYVPKAEVKELDEILTDFGRWVAKLGGTNIMRAGVGKTTLEEAKQQIEALIQDAVTEAYRKGYIAGHQKGTYGKSKRELRVNAYAVCPICKHIGEEVSQLNTKENK